ncbi:MAG: flagellar hook-basal body complex protein FliE [Phycisphaerales bacterium]|nr:MAG: flagellar hook-basal body complex protein FliE [Phycisphaerales bacterium]
MSDPLGLIGSTTGVSRPGPVTPPMAPGVTGRDQKQGPAFKELLMRQINQVNELQRDAKEAIEDLAAGRRDDVESVILATQKADTAFRMLLQVRNKVMNAYDEVKQMRV